MIVPYRVYYPSVWIYRVHKDFPEIADLPSLTISPSATSDTPGTVTPPSPANPFKNIHLSYPLTPSSSPLSSPPIPQSIPLYNPILPPSPFRDTTLVDITNISSPSSAHETTHDTDDCHTYLNPTSLLACTHANHTPPTTNCTISSHTQTHKVPHHPSHNRQGKRTRTSRQKQFSPQNADLRDPPWGSC